MKRTYHKSMEVNEVCPLNEENGLELVKAKRVRYSLRNREILVSGDSANENSTSNRSGCLLTKTSSEPYETSQTNSNFLRKSETESCRGRPMCNIQNLPNEILTMVFSNLTIHELCTSVAPVCKSWYSIAMSPVLWRKLCFCGEILSTDDARKLLSRSPLLQEIKITNRTDVEDLLNEICSSNRDVKSVTIKRATSSKFINSWGWDWSLLHARQLNRLIRRCPKIRSLTLKEVSIRSGKFYSDLGVFLPNLTNIHLSHNHFLTPIHVLSIATTCSSLTRLWLSGEVCCGLEEDWERAYTALFTKRCKTLMYLQFDASRLKDNILKKISLCIHLKKLHLHKALNINCEGLTAIGSLCNLVSLRLHRANHLCSATAPVLFEKGNLKTLIYLSIAGSSCVNDTCAEAIATHCPNLHALSLALVDAISDEGIVKIITKCRFLHYLDLYCMRLVSGSAFEFIWKHAPSLNCMVVEALCDEKKENHVKLLLESSAIEVNRTRIWSTTGSCKCNLLR